MPKFSHLDLTDFTGAVFRATGFSEADAHTIAELMVASNLAGHDSHGVRNLPVYLGRIKSGEIAPQGQVTIVHETPTTALLDGHRTLGFVGAARAIEMGMAKAREAKISAVGVNNVDHVGRIGAYPERAAREGLICLAYVNAQSWGRLVTPFGGLQRRVGTNPVAVGLPNPEGPPILLDFATSVVAANKVRLAKERKKETGEGWLLDKEGRPSRDPEAFLDGLGMILPLGGAHGYKGYALAVMVDILAGILAGSGTAASQRDGLDNGTFLITLDPDAFLERDDYDRRVKGLLDYLRGTPTRPGDPPVMVPGDFEERNRQERLTGGIEIEPDVWAAMAAAGQDWGVTAPEALP